MLNIKKNEIKKIVIKMNKTNYSLHFKIKLNKPTKIKKK